MGASATEVVDALREVADPCCRERGISAVDMGLLEHVEIADGRATIDIALTSGWCPFQADLLSEISEAVRALPGVGDAEVRVTFAEAWWPDRLSPSARAKLRFLPEPSEIATDRYAALPGGSSREGSR